LVDAILRVCRANDYFLLRESGDFAKMLDWFTDSIIFRMAKEKVDSSLIEQTILEVIEMI
jgi:hypothetical protein